MGFCFRFVCLLACLLVYLFVFEKRLRERGEAKGCEVVCMCGWVGERVWMQGRGTERLSETCNALLNKLLGCVLL